MVMLPHARNLGNMRTWYALPRSGLCLTRPLVGDNPGQRIEFEDPTIVWAFTCMMRLMQNQSRYTLD